MVRSAHNLHITLRSGLFPLSKDLRAPEKYESPLLLQYSYVDITYTGFSVELCISLPLN